jgi:uncharacterized membrane protein
MNPNQLYLLSFITSLSFIIIFSIIFLYFNISQRRKEERFCWDNKNLQLSFILVVHDIQSTGYFSNLELNKRTIS